MRPREAEIKQTAGKQSVKTMDISEAQLCMEESVNSITALCETLNRRLAAKETPGKTSQELNKQLIASLEVSLKDASILLMAVAEGLAQAPRLPDSVDEITDILAVGMRLYAVMDEATETLNKFEQQSAWTYGRDRQCQSVS